MTTLIPVTSPRELVIAVAAVLSRAVPDDSALLVASVAEAAELDRGLLVVSERLTSSVGVPMADLNHLIRPRHPLGWRLADVPAEDLLEALARAGVPGEVSGLVQIGGAGPIGDILRRLLHPAQTFVADTPEAVRGVYRRAARDTVIVCAARGAEWLVSVAGRGSRRIPLRELKRTARRVRALGVDPGLRFGVAQLGWWWRFLRRPPIPDAAAPAPVARKQPKLDPDREAEDSLAFVTVTIDDLDREFSRGS